MNRLKCYLGFNLDGSSPCKHTEVHWLPPHANGEGTGRRQKAKKAFIGDVYHPSKEDRGAFPSGADTFDLLQEAR